MASDWIFEKFYGWYLSPSSALTAWGCRLLLLIFPSFSPHVHLLSETLILLERALFQPQTMSQKRTTYTLAYKLSIVRRIDEEGNLDKIARETKINRRCLQRWRANKNTMLQQAQTKKGARSYRLIGASGVTGRPAQYPQVEADLTEWVLEQRRKRLVLLLTFN